MILQLVKTMKHIQIKKLSTVFLLTFSIVGIIAPALADTSEKSEKNNINLTQLGAMGLLGAGVTAGGLGLRLKNAQDRRKQLEEKLANTSSEIDKLERTYNSLQQESDHKDNRVSELKQRLEQQQIDLSQQIEIERKLQQEIKEHQSKIQQLEECDRRRFAE